MIKTFETFSVRPPIHVGDWLIDDDGDIGVLDSVGYSYVEAEYYVIYPNIPSNSAHPASLNIEHIIHYGTEEEMKFIMSANKYNL